MTVAYLKTDPEIIESKISMLRKIVKKCSLCPRECNVNRFNGEKGYCRSESITYIDGYQKHFGEESQIVGYRGSGTIFFSGCSLLCGFCQNYEISHGYQGYKTESYELSEIMLRLKNDGCHNINLVTPTHFIHEIVEAVYEASKKGLNIPIVYNSSGYEKVSTLRILDGIIDIYMPDFKFMDKKTAKETCNAEDYPVFALDAIKEMQRQVGDLQTENNIAKRGLIIRHLVMPNDVCGTKAVLKKIKDEISDSAFVNIMAQYRPFYRAFENKKISRPINTKEYLEALEYWNEGCP